MDVAAVAFLAALIFVKEAGLPVPVPGDLLVLGAGVAAAARPGPDAVITLAAILLAGFVGGVVQFLLIRGAARRPFLWLLGRLGISEASIESLGAMVGKRGFLGVALARMTPGVRVAAVPASAVASLQFGTFSRGLVVGNSVFVGAHFGLGFLVGAPALYIARELASPGVALATFGILAAIGLVGWLLIRRRRLLEGMGGTPAYDEWTDCSCPACLTISALNGAGRASLANAE